MRHKLSAWAYLLGWRVVRLLPARVAYGLFARIADQIWRRRGPGVRRLEANLARVRPDLGPVELRHLSRAGLASYLRYWCDSFRLPSWSADEVRAGVRIEGDDAVREALDAGRGVVAALPHQGNWDLAGAWAAYDLCVVTTVAERLEPVEVFDAFMAYRTSIGIEALPLGDPGVFTTLMRRLRDGRLVPLLMDRDLSRSGLEVDLCGHPARVAAGPATLAEMTGANLHPVNIWYEPAPELPSRHRVVIKFHPALPRPDLPTRDARIAALTQACVDVIGAGLAEHPEDWHMLQPVFSADLDPARLARTETRPETRPEKGTEKAAPR